MIEVDLDLLYDELLKDYQKKRNAPRPRKDGTLYTSKGKIYISTLVSSECDKQLRLMFEDAPKDPEEDPWPGLENEIGTLIHDKIQQAFIERKGLAEIEKKISIEIEGIRLNMKVDGVFHNGNVLEIKTMGSKDYGMKKPREKDVLQANFYLGILEVKTAIITYLKRENGRHIKSFQFEFDRDKYKLLLGRICNIIKDRGLRHNKRACRFCSYTKECIKRGRPW